MIALEEPKKRNVAYKLRIGDILKGKPMMQEDKFLFLEIGDKNVVRVNVIANVIDKYVMDGERKYATLTVDDASGQVRIKAFGEDIVILKEFTQGDTLQIVGNVREFNNELYIMPEVLKKVDPRWLLVRKLEIQSRMKSMPQQPGAIPLKDALLDKIKLADSGGGIDVDVLMMEADAAPDAINVELKKLLEDGLVYEPKPGKLRYLG